MSINRDKELVLQALREYGQRKAQELQAESAAMDGTALYKSEDYIPDFRAAAAEKNMLERHAGMTDGFICRSSAGRVVRLIQNYDSTVYTQEPEELPAQWGLVWSTDPDKALPFVAISTSPYAVGDCASEGGQVYRSKIGENVWSPQSYPAGWELVGPVGGPYEANQEPVPNEGNTTNEGDTAEGEESAAYPDWVQPAGAHNAYNTGDIVRYNGTLYRSKIDNNVWSPDTYPTGWETV